MDTYITELCDICEAAASWVNTWGQSCLIYSPYMDCMLYHTLNPMFIKTFWHLLVIQNLQNSEKTPGEAVRKILGCFSFSMPVSLTIRPQGLCRWLACSPSFLATAESFFSSTRPNPMSSSSRSSRTWAASWTRREVGGVGKIKRRFC